LEVFLFWELNPHQLTLLGVLPLSENPQRFGFSSAESLPPINKIEPLRLFFVVIKKISIFYEKRSYNNIVKDDSLIDYDNDGFADCRSITINGVSYFGTQTYYDTNLDGHYDKKENNNAEKYINEMLSDDDDL